MEKTHFMDAVTPDKIALLSGWIDESGRTCIISHMHPDGDAAGSGSAMYHYLKGLGKEAHLVLPDPLSENLRFILPPDTVIGQDEPGRAGDLLGGCDLLICLDFNKASRVAPFSDALLASKARKVLIDHHTEPDTADFGICFSKPDVSSTCELLYWILKALNAHRGAPAALDPACAEALMCGMTTDTNNFANSVWPSTLSMASDLLSMGVDRDAIIDRLMNCYRENRFRVIGYLLSEKLRIQDGTAYMVLRREETERFGIRDGELEGIVNIPLGMEKVKVSIFLREEQDCFRVSIRSKKGYSALALAKNWYDGGGHEQAAGGKLRFPQTIPGPDAAEGYIKEHISR